MHVAWQAQYKRHVHVRALISWQGLHLGASDLWFAKKILRDRCSTSYDLASFFCGRPGRPSTLDRWSGKIAKRIGTRLSALHSTFHFWRKSRRIALRLMLSSSKLEEVSQNSFVLDAVKFKKWRSLAELFRFWRCSVQKLLRKSCRIAHQLLLQFWRRFKLLVKMGLLVHLCRHQPAQRVHADTPRRVANGVRHAPFSMTWKGCVAGVGHVEVQTTSKRSASGGRSTSWKSRRRCWNIWLVRWRIQWCGHALGIEGRVGDTVRKGCGGALVLWCWCFRVDQGGLGWLYHAVHLRGQGDGVPVQHTSSWSLVLLVEAGGGWFHQGGDRRASL